MKYLVTGGSGFVGSHLCDKLIQEGHEVICIDNNLTSSKSNIEHLLHNNNFQYVYSDILDIRDIECDGIFHLASPTDPVVCKKYPLITIDVNTTGTSKLVKIAMEKGIPLLYMSSIRVKDEQQTCYSEAKRIGETYCLQSNDLYGTKCKIARCSHIYGPRMAKNDGRVIPTFIRNALSNEDITVIDTVDSFCYVDDAVRGLYKFMQSEHKGVIEFCGDSTSIVKLAEMIKKIIKSKSKIIFSTATTMKRGFADNEAEILLKWRPKISLLNGLNKMLNL
jgi:nucleoside-diphosphate-sugar epimerase